MQVSSGSSLFPIFADNTGSFCPPPKLLHHGGTNCTTSHLLLVRHCCVFSVYNWDRGLNFCQCDLQPTLPDPRQHMVCSSPELAQVVMPCLAICGARDTNGEARLELSELQKDDGQVMNEEQSIHQGHGVLDDSLIVLILRIMMFTWHFKPQQKWFSFECLWW